MINQEFYPHVYYVTTDTLELSFNPLAIRPTLQRDVICWEDTDHGKAVRFSHINKRGFLPNTKIPAPIEFTTFKGEIVTLSFLTLELYNECVKKQAAGSPSFNSTEELQHFYLTSAFYSF